MQTSPGAVRGKPGRGATIRCRCGEVVAYIEAGKRIATRSERVTERIEGTCRACKRPVNIPIAAEQ